MLLHLVRATTGAELTIIEIMTIRIYHRFTLDEKDKVQALRLFKVSSCFAPTYIIMPTQISTYVCMCVCYLVGRTEMGPLLSFGRGRQEPLPTRLPLFAEDHQGLIEEANLYSMAKVGAAPEKGRTR
jgi:hypothetical protein